jgi:excisionase family DNA binding protein
MKFLTTKQLAEILNVKESWLRRQIFTRKIPFMKIRGLIRFNQDDIEVWIKNNSKTTHPEGHRMN